MKRVSMKIGSVPSLALVATLGMTLFPGKARAQTFPEDSQWIPLQTQGTNMGDVRGDASGGQGERDLVGDVTNPVAFIYQDASYLFFRLRLDGSPLKNNGLEPFGWGCAIDTDGVFTGYEFLSVVDGIENPDQVEYRWNQNQTGNGSLSDAAEVVVGAWPATTHARVLLANTTFGGTPDHFLDWAIPLATMRMPPGGSGAPAIAAGSVLRFACGSSNNAQRIEADPSGVNGSGAVFSDVVTDPVACSASSCTACNVASACGSACTPCTGATPACSGGTGTCVRCVTSGDCPPGATCAAATCSLAAPSITSPTSGSQINDDTPLITGTTAPNAAVTVTLDGSPVGSVTADGTGAWSFQVVTPLSLQSHGVTATAVAGAGSLAVTSPSSATVSFTVISGCLTNTDCAGRTPYCETSSNACVRCLSTANCPDGASCVAQVCTLASPAVTAPAAGSTINVSSPTIVGTAPAGSTVTLSVDGSVVGVVGASEAGAFSFSLPMALTPGSHGVTATATVGSGALAVVSDPSPTNSFTLIVGCLADGDCAGATPRCRTADHVCVGCLVTGHCPAGAVCTSNACSLEKPVITSPANGATINDPTPIVTGTGVTGASLTLWVDGVALATTTVSAGTWSVEVTQALVTGSRTLLATARVGSGDAEVSASSDSVTIIVIQGCLNDGECAPPSGRCKPSSNSCVQCLGDEDCGEATPHCVAATNQCVRCQGDGDCPVGSSCSNLTCLVPVPTINSPAEGLTTRDRRPEIVGTSVAGATVTFYVDDVVVGTAQADGAGAFLGVPSADLTVGARSLRATATLGASALAVTSASSAPRSFTIVSGCLLDGHCASGNVCDVSTNACVRCLDNDDCPSGANCQSQSCTLPPPIAQSPAPGSSVQDATPLFSGTATPGAVVTVQVDGMAIGTALADPMGAWQLQAPAALAPGAHQYTLAASVGSGADVVQSAPTAPVSFTIVGGCLSNADCGARLCKTDTGVCVRCLETSDCPVGGTCSDNACALAAPVITSPVDGASTNLARPVFAGTATPGATVTVTLDGQIVLVTTADGGGNWQVTVEMDLPRGNYTAVASATVGSGPGLVTSPTSGAVSFEAVQGCVSNDNCAAATPLCETGAGVCVRCLQTSQCPMGASCVSQDCLLPTPVITSPAPGMPIDGMNLVITGTATPGAVVTIVIDGQPVGMVTADGQGNFSYPLPMALAPGAHTLSVSATVGMGAGSVSSGASTPTPVQVGAGADAGTGMADAGTGEAGTGDAAVSVGDGGPAGDASMADAGAPPEDAGNMTAMDAPVTSPDAPTPPIVPPGIACSVDSDCGASDSGVVCDDQSRTCVAGCRARAGNVCPSTVFCTSTGTEIGQCDYDKRYAIAGGGCQLAGRGGAGSTGALWLALVALGLVARRRARRPHGGS